MSPEAPPTAGASHDPPGPSTRRPFGFPRDRRLTTGAELDAVRQRGRRIRTEHLEFRAMRADAGAEGKERAPTRGARTDGSQQGRRDEVGAPLVGAPSAPRARAEGVGMGADGVRIGIIVPRHKHTAVDRNRLKRRLRELARTRLLPTLPSGHVVIRARPEAYAASFDALARQIERAGRDLVRVLGASGERGPG